MASEHRYRIFLVSGDVVTDAAKHFLTLTAMKNTGNLLYLPLPHTSRALSSYHERNPKIIHEVQYLPPVFLQII